MVHDDLKRLGVICWLDENEIRVGESIVSRISDGLKNCSALILFLSKASISSKWTSKGWQSFLMRQLTEGKVRLLPVLLEECEVPAILADIKYANFSHSYHDGFKEIYNALK
jgi:hypothetical protein